MGIINEILEKNLSYIRRYDRELCDRLAAIEALTMPIELIYTQKNEANLAVNGIPICAQEGAQDEAERLVSGLKLTPKSISVIFGTGFGYSFKLAAEKSQGTVILYEPNTELLRVALEMVDFSDVLCKEKVLITDNLKMLDKHFKYYFTAGAETSLITTNYHKTQQSGELNTLVDKLGRLQSVCTNNENQRTASNFQYVAAVLRNLTDLTNCLPVAAIKDSLKGKPAIIAAAGASLSDELETIKKYRKKAAIFAVSSSLKTLVNNGIIPDFVSVIERFDASNFIKDYETEKIRLIAEPYVNNKILNLPFKSKIISSSEENTVGKIYERAFNVEHEYFETKGTVAYNALYAARYAGCNPIILVGQDLAYVDGECYSKNSILSEIKCRKTESGFEVYVQDREALKQNGFSDKNLTDEQKEKEIDKRLESLNAQLITVTNNLGEELPTSQTFAIFIEYYKSFAESNKQDIDIYTTSLKGAKIDGFDYKPLGEILENFDDFEFDEEYLEVNVPALRLDSEFIDKELNMLSQVTDEIQAVKNDKYTVLNKLLDRGDVSQKMLSALKECLQHYIKIEEKYANNSIVYKETTYCSRNTMNCIFQELGTFSKENLLKIKTALNSFYEQDLERLNFKKERLSRIKEQIKNETCCTAG